MAGPAARWARRSGCLFIAGQFLFCGALLLSTIDGYEGIAVIAPAGGLSFIAGWLCLLLGGLHKPDV